MNVNQFKRQTSWCILMFVGALLSLPSVDGKPRFTQLPPSVLYVTNGGTARFVWNYHVDDRGLRFTAESPRWSFIDQNGSESTIGADDKYTNNWDFIINRATCPPRLLNPDRVSRELPATLVITNVTTADNGMYKCSLMLKAENPINHQVQLVVTVPPNFIPNHHEQTHQIIEGENLEIDCTANGPPTPNITWVNITDGSIKSQGSGSAVLSINNIQRYHAGVYECQAKNNPNEEAATRRTNITVYYKPTILKELSSKNDNSWNGKKVTLKCIANGIPRPNITWYNPNSQQITEDVRTIANGNEVTITTGEQDVDYGSYECQAKNIAGVAKLSILVTQLFPPGPPNATILEEHIEASSVVVRWNIPGYDGGSPVIDYKVQINSTKQPHGQNTSKFEHQFTGLRKNTRYGVKVYARNKVGYGNASLTIFTTKKKGPPPLPELHIDKNEISIILNWIKPDENGGEIKNYTVYRKVAVKATKWTPIHVVTDLSNLTFEVRLLYLEPGQTYWFIVTATNEFGESKISEEDKGKEVYIGLEVFTTTLTPTTGFATGENLNKNVEGQGKCSVIAVAVCVAFLTVSLVFNILLLLYIWKMRRTENLKSKRNTKKEGNEDPVYDKNNGWNSI